MKINDNHEIFGVPEQKNNKFRVDKTYNSLCKITTILENDGIWSEIEQWMTVGCRSRDVNSWTIDDILSTNSISTFEHEVPTGFQKMAKIEANQRSYSLECWKTLNFRNVCNCFTNMNNPSNMRMQSLDHIWFLCVNHITYRRLFKKGYYLMIIHLATWHELCTPKTLTNGEILDTYIYICVPFISVKGEQLDFQSLTRIGVLYYSILHTLL